MAKRVNISISYEYGGDEVTDDNIIHAEKEAWLEGTVGFDDIMAAGPYKLEVTVTEDETVG